MTRRRRIAVWTGGVLVLLLLALGAAEYAGWPFLRQPVQNAATRSTGTPVQMDGDFRLHLLGRPRLQVGHLRIAPAHNLPVPHLLDTRQVQVEWRWRDIWHWRQGEPLRLLRLQADTLDAQLVRGADGRASWQIGPQKARPTTPDEADEPLEGVPRFGLLQVRQGLIVVDDQPLKTRLRAELRGAEGEKLPDGTPAGYQATVTGQWQALPMQLQIRTGGTLAQLQEAQDSGTAFLLPLRIEGKAGAAQVLFDGRTTLPGEALRFDGRIRIAGPSLAQVGEPLGLTLPQTPPFDLRGTLAHEGRLWLLKAERAAIGRSLLEGDFRYDAGSKPGRLTGRLGGQRLLLADLAPAVGKPPTGREATPATPAGPRRVLPQRRFDLPSLNVMDADLQVAIGELDFGSDAVSPLRELRTHLLLDKGVLQLKDLKAVVAGGTFGGNTSLDARARPAKWAADMRFRTVDIAGWIPALRTGPGRKEAPARNTAALKQRRDTARQTEQQQAQAYLTGSLSGVVQVTGNGSSTAEILSTLDGQTQLTLRDGTLSHLATEVAGLDIAQAIGVLVRRDQPLPLRCARLDLQVRDGVVRPQLAVLDNRDSTIRIDGQIDLRDESMALRATSKPKDFSPLTLRAPVVVGGTLGAPKAGIEGQRLAAKVLGSLVLGAAVAPWAALLPLVDPGAREDGDPCAGVVAPGAAAPAASAPNSKAR